MFDLDYNNITEGVIIVVLGTVLGTAIIAFSIWLYKFKKKHERSESVVVPIYFYNEIVENAIKVQKFENQDEQDERKAFLYTEITRINNRPAELDKITVHIDALEFIVTRKVNEIITKRLKDSKIASEKEKNNE